MTIQKEGVTVIKKRAVSCQISRVPWSLPNTTTTIDTDKSRHRQFYLASLQKALKAVDALKDEDKR